jgi:hypothetical protein
MLRLKNPQDFGAGVLFLLIGLGGLWFGRDLEAGSASDMGPGYFPRLVSVGLLVFGIVFAARGVVLEGPPIEASRLRPTLLILAAISSFGFLIEPAGLAAATAAVVVVSAYANREADWRETVALALFMAVFCVAVFIYGLKQSMTVFGIR